MNPILSLRQQAGLTQIEAAKAAGMDQPRWSEVERRPTLRDTPYGTLERVAGALGVQVAELVKPRKEPPVELWADSVRRELESRRAARRA